jgi:3-hydroxyisobutyrate dehydrogenase-like beta-hydroxyacid dehydrogenase
VKAAIIGLGRMGGPLVRHAVRAGIDVSAYDIDGPAREAAAAKGASVSASAADAADGADVVAVVVFDDQQVRDVLTGPDGALRALRPGAVVAIHTTTTLQTIREVAAEATEAGAHVVDAGISGGEPGAQAGTLVTMVGGDEPSVDKARFLLETYSKEVVHAGPIGAGMALKLARNAAGYALMVAAQEAMELAATAGIDPAVVRHVLEATDTAGMLWAPFALGGPTPLDSDAPAELRRHLEHTRELGLKDLDHALALAQAAGLPVEFFTATRQAYPRSVRL